MISYDNNIVGNSYVNTRPGIQVLEEKKYERP